MTTVDRRTFSTLLAGTLAAPKMALAQSVKDKSAFYSGVGPDLTHFEVDFNAAALAKRGSVRLPGGVQYAWPHPSRKYLYVISSTGGVGIAPVPGFAPDQHTLIAFQLGPSGELSPHGDAIRLRYRPIHMSVDNSGEYALVAYNFPAGISVHRIKGDGSIGDEVTQPDNLEKGIYFHQIRATPANKSILVVARGNNPEGGKPEDPGSLHAYAFKNGVLSNMSKVAPNGGYGFGPRHLDFHPSQPWVYVSIERQNQLIVFKLTPDGDLVGESLFTKSTLADPAHRFPVQGAGPIHMHPTGSFVYLGNQRSLRSISRPANRPRFSKPTSTAPIREPSAWTTARGCLWPHRSLRQPCANAARSSIFRPGFRCSGCERTASSTSRANTTSMWGRSPNGGPA
jgi:6-phosphogluconolactonase (cycloisomerase 2 family)